jgi:hypothetical protein
MRQLVPIADLPRLQPTALQAHLQQILVMRETELLRVPTPAQGVDFKRILCTMLGRACPMLPRVILSCLNLRRAPYLLLVDQAHRRGLGIPSI